MPVAVVAAVPWAVPDCDGDGVDRPATRSRSANGPSCCGGDGVGLVGTLNAGERSLLGICCGDGTRRDVAGVSGEGHT